MTKKEILEHICYTELVYGRINKKLQLHLSNQEIEDMIQKIITETDEQYFKRKGKNIYISNFPEHIRITINIHTCRVITIDKI